MRILFLSDLGRGDEVETPSGRRALVKGIEQEAVIIQFIDDGEQATIRPHLLRLISRAKPRAFPAKFFNEHAAT